MKTKDLIKFIENDVADWDGWEEEDQMRFGQIVAILKHYNTLKKENEALKGDVNSLRTRTIIT